MADQSPVVLDDNYFRDNFNTPLSPAEEQQYQLWALGQQRRGRNVFADTDYDNRGYWKNLGQIFPSSGHWPDTYKKPNHPTFSNESIYHNTPSPFGTPWQGGTWGVNSFTPSQHMLAHTHSLVDLANYLRRVEPGYKLGEQP